MATVTSESSCTTSEKSESRSFSPSHNLLALRLHSASSSLSGFKTLQGAPSSSAPFPPPPTNRPRPPPLLLSLRAFSLEGADPNSPLSPTYPFPSAPRRPHSAPNSASPHRRFSRPPPLQPGSPRSDYFNLDFSFLDEAPSQYTYSQNGSSQRIWDPYSTTPSKFASTSNLPDDSFNEGRPTYRSPFVSKALPFPSPPRARTRSAPPSTPPSSTRPSLYQHSDTNVSTDWSDSSGSNIESWETTIATARPLAAERYDRVAEFLADTAFAMEGEKMESLSQDFDTGPSGSPEPKIVDLGRMYEHRRRAIEELLETEAIYASDMVVVRDIYIARAKGASLSSIGDHVMRLGLGLGQAAVAEPSLDSNTPRRPSLRHSPSGSGITIDPSTIPIISPRHQLEIFRNLSDIAVFAESFSRLLDGAFAGGASGWEADRVGELFLDHLPRIQELYGAYCAGHPLALARLQDLEPNLTTYFSECKTLSSGRTKAWDLVSLFIKPVQRVLKYHLLLQQILSGTPIDHPSRRSLQLAYEKMLVVAANVNQSQKSAMVAAARPEQHRHDSSFLVSSAFGISVSKKLRRPSQKDREVGQQERNNMFDTLAALVTSTRDTVVRFSKETTEWARSTRVGLESHAIMVDGWIEISALSEGGEPQPGGRHEQLCTFMDTVIGPILDGASEDLYNEIHHSLLLKTDHLLSLFQNPLAAISYRNSLLRDHTRYILKKNPADRSQSEEFITLTTRLLDELPKFLDNVSRYFNIILAGLSSAQKTYSTSVLAIWKPFEERWAPMSTDGERRPLLPMLAVGLGIDTCVSSSDSLRSGRSTATSFRRRPRATSPPSPSSISSPTRPPLERKSSSARQTRLSSSLTLPPSIVELDVRSPSRASSSTRSLSQRESKSPLVLYVGQCVKDSAPGKLSSKGDYPVLSFETGDKLFVEREVADTEKGGAGWLLGRSSKGEYGWGRSENFGKLTSA